MPPEAINNLFDVIVNVDDEHEFRFKPNEIEIKTNTVDATDISGNVLTSYIDSPTFTMTFDTKDWKNTFATDCSYNVRDKRFTLPREYELRKAFKKFVEDVLELGIDPYEQLATNYEEEEKLAKFVHEKGNLTEALIEYYLDEVD